MSAELKTWGMEDNDILHRRIVQPFLLADVTSAGPLGLAASLDIHEKLLTRYVMLERTVNGKTDIIGAWVVLQASGPAS